MDAKQFIAEFGHIANAMGGVQCLREMILELAISGRLLEHQEYLESSKDLLLKVEAHRKKLVKNGEMKRPKQLSEITLDEMPFTLPEQWEFQRLGLVCDIVRGITFPASRKETSKSNENVVCLRTANIQKEVDWDNLIYVDPSFAKRKDQWVQDGDTLISMANSYELVGKVSLVRQVKYKSTFGGFISAIRPHLLNSEYLYLLLSSPYMQNTMRATASQTVNIANISLAGMQPIPVPIPPLAEQARIVAKVDELMALCDQLEEQQQQKRQLQNLLRQASLQAVSAASSPFELKQHWKRLQDNFEQLFSAPEDVKELRDLVLDLAVNGHLTQNLQTDESAILLKNKIEKAKEVGISKGYIKKKKPVVGEILESVFIPSYWTQLRLDDALTNIDAGWSPKCLAHSRRDEEAWGVLKTTSVQVLKFLPNEHKELPIALDPRPEYEIKLGDILVTRAGPSNRVGICCVVDEAPAKLMISDKLIRFHIVGDLIDARFITLCLSAGESGRIFKSMKTGMADSQMNITQDRLRSVPIPLPPRAEQNRILSRVEELMKTCDHYENKLSLTNNLAQQFATASVSSLTGIHKPQEEEPLKVPQTELVAPVSLGPNKPSSKDAAPLTALLARHNGQMNATDLWQRFGGEIDTFYAQLKAEVAHGWIDDPSYLITNNDEDREEHIANPKLYPSGNLVAKVIEKTSN